MKNGITKVSKIYLRENSEYCLRYVKEKIMSNIYKRLPNARTENFIEFTNLSDVWHDAKKDTHIEKVKGNNAIVIIGLNNEKVAYKYLWNDIGMASRYIKSLSECKAYDRVIWAYLRDLMPKMI